METNKLTAKEMKIHSGRVKGLTYYINSVPMALLSESLAQKNHGQSLTRLNERGGLSVTEILAIIKNDRQIAFRAETANDIEELCYIVKKHNEISAQQETTSLKEENERLKEMCEGLAITVETLQAETKMLNEAIKKHIHNG